MGNYIPRHEDLEQEALFEWAQMYAHRYPELALMYHIPNGGKRDRITAAKLKRQGVKPGVPDICLPVPRCGFHGLYIELKDRGGRASSAQEEWILALEAQGYRAVICVGWREASDEIHAYLSEKVRDRR